MPISDSRSEEDITLPNQSLHLQSEEGISITETQEDLSTVDPELGSRRGTMHPLEAVKYHAYHYEQHLTLPGGMMQRDVALNRNCDLNLALSFIQDLFEE